MHACDLLGYWLPQAEATLQKAAKKELEKAQQLVTVGWQWGDAPTLAVPGLGCCAS